MLRDQELFYNLVTRDALFIHGGVAYPLAGPFSSREEAERAAEALIGRLQVQACQDGCNAPSHPTRAAD